MKHFTLTEDHVTLLRASNIGWHHIEWGAPCVDGKRPYGNGDMTEDIARLLGWELWDDGWGDVHVSKDQHDAAVALHAETETALQVVLAAGSFTPGDYEADDYSYNWRAVVPVGEEP